MHVFIINSDMVVYTRVLINGKLLVNTTDIFFINFSIIIARTLFKP